MRARRVDAKAHRRTLDALHTLTFPSDTPPSWRADGLAWIVYDGGEPVAFLYAEPLPDSWYFSRVGVMPAARGRGLQRRLMRLMRKATAGCVLISTTYQNPASANNFVREQWMTYLPAHPWGAPDTIYWRLDP
jgi:ribosomal protein S18 acetylase RimI-like enzyme